jgi:two-component system sensor histidine kinase DesK
MSTTDDSLRDATRPPAAGGADGSTRRPGTGGAEPARRKPWNGRSMEFLFLAYLLMYPLPWVFGYRPTTADLVAAALGVSAFLPLYFTGYRTQGLAQIACALGILAIGLLLIPFHGVWGIFPVYAAAMSAYVRPMRHAVYTMGAIGVAVAAAAWWLALPVYSWFPALFFGALVGISSLYQARIEAANSELEASRDEARRLAVVAERERIARDLHDVLGHTLTVVAVKADLAAKLVDRDPAAARREVEEIHRTARQALADVRSAVTGMRSATLAAELAGARDALDSARIAPDVRVDAGALPPPVETALAYVLREAVTNVVRHSGAGRCTIALSRDDAAARLEVRDDGRGGAAREGNGIAGMRLRLAPLGGTLALENRDGTRVIATVPLHEDAR